MVPLGLSVTACALIGNSIGKQDVPLAKGYFKMISAYTLIFCLLVALFLIVFRAEVTALFTNQDEVKQLVIYCMPVVAFKYIFDGYQGLLGLGVIPALGM